MDPVDVLHPIFPLEVFSLIIDSVTTRSPHLSLSDEQIGTLRACSIVCQSFLPLCRTYLFDFISLGFEKGREARIDHLIELLCSQPTLKTYIRHLCFGLPDLGYSWPPDSSDSVILLGELRIDTLLDLPDVQTITCVHPSNGSAPNATPDDPNFLWPMLIDAYARKGTLRNLVARSKYNLPWEVLNKHTTLHTLRLDRCWSPSIIPFPTLKRLTLMNDLFEMSYLSFFPNLEELEAASMRFTTSEPGSTAGRGAPPFGLKSLSLEQETFHSIFSPLTSSSITFVGHIRDKAREYGVQAFAQLTALSITLNPSPELMAMVASLLEEVPALRFFSFQVTPPLINLTPKDLITQLQDEGHSVSVKCVPCNPQLFWNVSYFGRGRSVLFHTCATLPGSFDISHLFPYSTSSSKAYAESETLPVSVPSVTTEDNRFTQMSEKIVSWARKKHARLDVLKDVEIRMMYVYDIDEVRIDDVESRQMIEGEIARYEGSWMATLAEVYFEDLDDPNLARAAAHFILDRYSLTSSNS